MSFHDLQIELVPLTKITGAEYRIKLTIHGIILRSVWSGSKAMAEKHVEEINKILRSGIKDRYSIAGNLEFSRSEP